jgi:DNA-directed RNA polymerase subunit beta
MMKQSIGESDPSPEAQLLRAIFGDKAGDVKDASLKTPPSFRGVVINKKLFAKAIKDPKTRSEDKKVIALLKEEFQRKQPS